LGHDLGHPPFGHIGEQALDDCLQERYGLSFRHNHHSLRIVERLERLNLTDQVRDGILRHPWKEDPPSTLEARIVRLVDRVAYINHDIDDAVRAGVLRREDLPADDLAVLGETGSQRIDTLVRDVVERSAAAGDIVQGEDTAAAMDGLRTFMFERVYLGTSARAEHPRIERMVRALFAHYAGEPPPAMTPEASEPERVVDWLAGMTDRYAIRAFTEMYVPQGF
jgi:dGTPase